MISGEDTVYLVRDSVPDSISSFLDSWLKRWPDLRVAVDEDETFSRWSDGTTRLPETPGQLLVARDESMEASWDDLGYELDVRQEGPFAISYDKATWSNLRATVLDDPYARGKFKFEPYEVNLLGNGYYLVSVVTPPRDSVFSVEVLTLLAEFLAQGLVK